MIAYISKEDEDMALLTPEIMKCPNSMLELQVYIELYLRRIRDDLMRIWDGEWRIIDVDDNLEFQHMDDTSTGTYVRKMRVRYTND